MDVVPTLVVTVGLKEVTELTFVSADMYIKYAESHLYIIYIFYIHTH